MNFIYGRYDPCQPGSGGGCAVRHMCSIYGYQHCLAFSGHTDKKTTTENDAR